MENPSNSIIQEKNEADNDNGFCTTTDTRQLKCALGIYLPKSTQQ